MQLMKKSAFAISVFLLISTGCTQKNDPQPIPTPVSKTYESCCGDEPVEFTYKTAYVFTPNVFTPNGDEINDFFIPVVNADVGAVFAFQVFSENGDTTLFYRPQIDFKQPDEYGWNGNDSNGKPHIGRFKYAFSVQYPTDGSITEVKGYACRIECGEEAAFFKDKKDCFFPVQINADGKPDASLPNNESDCFK
jgi:hypothetical protein